MKIYCTCCAKQAVSSDCSASDFVTTRIDAVADIGGIICRHCNSELDENGNFPEELALCGGH
jgi:hypothetical protein